MKKFECVCVSGACGGLLMTGETPGFFYSPGWPESYPPNQECTWLIRSPSSIVELNILSLDMEGFPPCYFDSITVRDGKLEQDDVITNKLYHLLDLIQPSKTITE